VTGDYNLAYIAKYLSGISVRVLTFAHRQQGILVAPGNPHTVTNWDDLPRVRFVNRQRGSGTRLLIDYELSQRGIDPAAIAGYDREEYTHLAVAVAVQTGLADAGIAVRSAAAALDLPFVPVGWERYDFVIPIEHWEHPGVARIRTVLTDPAFHALLNAQPGYSARATGQLQQG